MERRSRFRSANSIIPMRITLHLLAWLTLESRLELHQSNTAIKPEASLSHASWKKGSQQFISITLQYWTA